MQPITPRFLLTMNLPFELMRRVTAIAEERSALYRRFNAYHRNRIQKTINTANRSHQHGDWVKTTLKSDGLQSKPSKNAPSRTSVIIALLELGLQAADAGTTPENWKCSCGTTNNMYSPACIAPACDLTASDAVWHLCARRHLDKFEATYAAPGATLSIVNPALERLRSNMKTAAEQSVQRPNPRKNRRTPPKATRHYAPRTQTQKSRKP